MIFKDFILGIIFLNLILIPVGESAVPVFSGIQIPINIGEGTVTETLFSTFTVTDPDGGTVTSCTHDGNNAQFDVRQDSGDNTVFELYVLAGAGLNYYVTTHYNLTISCIDTGFEQSSQNFTVNVLPNSPPVFTTLPGTVTVLESTGVQTELYLVNYTDVEGDVVTCSMRSVTPYTGAFGMWETSQGYTVHVLNNPGLSYATTESYEISVRCSDNFGFNTETLHVDVIPNSAPFFTNLPASTVTVDASNTPAATLVFTVSASDNDSTALTFSMTSFPASPALFDIDAVTGDITTTADLIYAVDNGHSLTVTVSDGIVMTTETLTIILNNANSAPVIINLNDSISITEDTVANTDIFVLSVSDADNDNVVLYFTVTPSEYAYFFDITGNVNKNVTLTQSPDFEQQSTFTMNIYVSDDWATSGPFTLFVTVTDVNEPCTFDANTYHVSMYEGASGTGDVDPGFLITDDDIGDTTTLSIVPTANSSYFDIDPTTGIIEFATNYDRDGVHATEAVLIVQCADTIGDTGTATVSVTILDINDNAPAFDKTGSIVYFNEDINPGGLLAKLAATDIDSGVNNDIVYSWTTASSTGDQYFQLNAGGAVVLKQSSSTLTSGDLFRYVVTATDQGSPQLSGSTTIDIVYKVKNYVLTTTTAAATASTDDDDDFWNDTTNIALVAATAALAAILLGLLSYCLLKKLIKNKVFMKTNGKAKAATNMESQPKKIDKPTPAKNKFDFWHKKDDMEKNNHIQLDKIGGTIYMAHPRVSIE